MQSVFVGLSGGVDSAVSAALLKERGFDVVGAFIKIWSPEFIECTWQRDRLDAMRVAAHLGIPFREIDLSEEYKRDVIEQMVSSYARGITPNPDVLCNSAIKFGSFARWAQGEGADLIATGHYARTSDENDRRELLRGADLSKDQSYFLYRIAPDELVRTMFPIGGMNKDEVRREAARRELPVSKKPDSQGLCFVGDITLSEFLAHYIPLSSGAVLSEAGEAIGEHDGAALYTLGQRHGFRTAGGAPLYVIATDLGSNTITVSPDRGRAAHASVRIVDPSWINGVPAAGTYDVVARYRERPVRARFDPVALEIVFEAPHIAAPGQSLVIYDRDRVCGGGVIDV